MYKRMTVGMMIETLKDLDKDLPLVLASDEECNNVRPLYENDIGKVSIRYNYYYDVDKKKEVLDSRNVDVGIFELTDELLAKGYTDEDLYEDKGVLIG